MPGSKMSSVDRIAPGFRERAIQLHTKEGYQGSDVFDLLIEEQGEGSISRTAFYRWWKSVLNDHTVIEHSAKAAVAVVELIKATGADLDRNLELLAKQKAQAMVLGSDPEKEKEFLLKVVRETNRAKKLEIEKEKWEQQKRKDDEAR